MAREQNLSVEAEFRSYEKLPVPLGVYQLVNGAYKLRLVSDGLCDLLHLSREEILLKYADNPAAFTHPDDISVIIEARAYAMLHPDQAYRVVSRLLTGTSGYIWAACNGKIKRIGGSELLLAQYSDITDRETLRINMEMERSRRESLLSEILNTTQTAIFWKDVNRRFLGVNRAFLDYYGFSDEKALLGKNDEEMGWHSDPGLYKNDELQVLLSGESTHRVHGKCFSRGENRDIVASKSPLYVDGKIAGLVGSFEDVTTECRQREEITDLNGRLENEIKENDFLMEATRVSIIRIRMDEKYTVEWGNESAYASLGYTRDEFQALFHDSLSEYFSKYPQEQVQLRSALAEARENNRPNFDVALKLPAKTGFRWVKGGIAFMKYKNGAPRVMYAVYTDISEVVETQEKLRAAETELVKRATAANDAKSEFLSRISHDMRTPLNVILGMTHIAADEDNPSRTKDCLDKITASSRFLLGLINDVLDMAKAERGKIELRPEPYRIEDFYGYIDAVVRPLCVQKDLKLVLDARPVSGFLPLMDKLRSNQIFFNLVSNAVKFTPAGGTLTLCLHERMTGDGRIAMKVIVKDTGVGMSVDFQKKLFEPFTQEQRNDVAINRGSGLGLSIVKRMVDLMHGIIRVQSEIGKGTTFTMTGTFDCIPVDQYTEKKKKDGARKYDAIAGMRVLLCEDHPLNQEIAKALLEKERVLVDVAENGKIGVERLGSSAPGTYTAVLMDIRMPVMDGYEATQKIRALNHPDAKKIPIIAMTADVFADDVRKCLAIGMNGHIAKPIDPCALYAALEDAVK